MPNYDDEDPSQVGPGGILDAFLGMLGPDDDEHADTERPQIIDTTAEEVAPKPAFRPPALRPALTPIESAAIALTKAQDQKTFDAAYAALVAAIDRKVGNQT